MRQSLGLVMTDVKTLDYVNTRFRRPYIAGKRIILGWSE